MRTPSNTLFEGVTESSIYEIAFRAGYRQVATGADAW